MGSPMLLALGSIIAKLFLNGVALENDMETAIKVMLCFSMGNFLCLAFVSGLSFFLIFILFINVIISIKKIV